MTSNLALFIYPFLFSNFHPPYFICPFPSTFVHLFPSRYYLSIPIHVPIFIYTSRSFSFHLPLSSHSLHLLLSVCHFPSILLQQVPAIANFHLPYLSTLLHQPYPCTQSIYNFLSSPLHPTPSAFHFPLPTSHLSYFICLYSSTPVKPPLDIYSSLSCPLNLPLSICYLLDSIYLLYISPPSATLIYPPLSTPLHLALFVYQFSSVSLHLPIFAYQPSTSFYLVSHLHLLLSVFLFYSTPFVLPLFICSHLSTPYP